MSLLSSFEKGYCYLRVFRSEHRDAVKSECGSWPTLRALLSVPSAWFDVEALMVSLTQIEPGYYHVSDGCGRELCNAVMTLPFEQEVWPEASMGSAVVGMGVLVRGLYGTGLRLADRFGGKDLASPAFSVDGSSLAPEHSASQVGPGSGAAKSVMSVALEPPVFPGGMLSDLPEQERAGVLQAYYRAYEVYCSGGVFAPPSSLASSTLSLSSVSSASRVTPAKREARKRRRARRRSRASSCEGSASSGVVSSSFPVSSGRVVSESSVDAELAGDVSAGYCYLDMVRPGCEDVVAASLGPSPTFKELLSLDVGLVSLEGELCVSRSSPGKFHLSASGPTLRETLRCVAGRSTHALGSIGEKLSKERCAARLCKHVSPNDRLGVGGPRFHDFSRRYAATCSETLSPEKAVTISGAVGVLNGATTSPVVHVLTPKTDGSREILNDKCNFKPSKVLSSGWQVFDSPAYDKTCLVVVPPAHYIAGHGYSVGSGDKYTYAILPAGRKLSVTKQVVSESVAKGELRKGEIWSSRLGRYSAEGFELFAFRMVGPLQEAWSRGAFASVFVDRNKDFVERTGCEHHVLSSGVRGTETTPTARHEISQPYKASKPVLTMRYYGDVGVAAGRMIVDRRECLAATVLSSFLVEDNDRECVVTVSDVLHVRRGASPVAIDGLFSSGKIEKASGSSAKYSIQVSVIGDEYDYDAAYTDENWEFEFSECN